MKNKIALLKKNTLKSLLWKKKHLHFSTNLTMNFWTDMFSYT